MFSARVLALVMLVLQNSTYTLLRRAFSATHTQDLPATVILMASEILKFVVSACLLENQAGGDITKLQSIIHALRMSLPMSVPAITYVAMNTISFYALGYIDATVFSMISQMKILTTALFAVPVLGRSQSCAQWRALTMLTLAVTIITYHRGASKDGGVTVGHFAAFALGVGLTMIEISLSGWIGCYFEKYLKDGAFSVWGRNLQLSSWSILLYSSMQLPAVFRGFIDSGRSPETGGLIGSAFSCLGVLLTPLPLALVFLGGAGGLLVAIAIKHADAVLKSIATACSLLLVIACESVATKTMVDPVVLFASVITILALQSYQDAPKVEAPAPPRYIQVAQQEGDEERGSPQDGKRAGATVVGRT